MLNGSDNHQQSTPKVGPPSAALRAPARANPNAAGAHALPLAHPPPHPRARKNFPLHRYLYILYDSNMSSQPNFCDTNQPYQVLGNYVAAVVPNEVPDVPAFVANMKSSAIFWLKGLTVLPTTTSLAAVEKTLWVIEECQAHGNTGALAVEVQRYPPAALSNLATSIRGQAMAAFPGRPAADDYVQATIQILSALYAKFIEQTCEDDLYISFDNTAARVLKSKFGSVKVSMVEHVEAHLGARTRPSLSRDPHAPPPRRRWPSTRASTPSTSCSTSPPWATRSASSSSRRACASSRRT